MRNPAYYSLTDQQLSEIDEFCDRFDRELVDGRDPRIESFLADAPEAARDGLLAELLAMELEYLTQQNAPSPEEYFHRFPQQRNVIAGVFNSLNKTRAEIGQTNIQENGSATGNTAVPPDLDNFRSIKLIGQGGMGVVWLADQIQPVERRVALKLIKSELASPELLARFETEKHALALMHHQNIARVLDAGLTNDSHPYFVMEFVDGIPITQYCDDNKLSVDERLKLLVAVCKAVQHAHQKGIVHRDLKPSNVLVTEIDGEAVPKVIDFGLAKAVVQEVKLTDATVHTEFGKVVGTVQYMSPEQAELKELDAQDIDTRTDVYSLGVILYELLTGSTPLDKELLGRTALLKILEMIREEDPLRPSDRLSSSTNESSTEVGSLRRMQPARLQRILQGELDWVVMKALEKDRTRRYQTANDLAQDLTNFLTGEAVVARPPSRWYQIQKFARRNRGMVAALLAIGAVLLAGVAGTTYGLIQANQKTQLAIKERGKAEAAEAIATSESKRASNSEAAAKFQLAVARFKAGRAFEARSFLHQIEPKYRDNFEWHYCNRRFLGSDVTCYGHTKTVFDVAFTPDGKSLVSASGDGTIKLWDAATGQQLEAFNCQLGTVVKAIAVSPDGTRIASACDDATLRILDAESGEIIMKLAGHSKAIADVAFSPTGHRLASASADKTVIVWDTATGEAVKTLRGHQGAVQCVVFSPDGKRIASARNGALSGRDASVRIWDSHAGEPLNVIRPQRDVQCLAFSPDGTRLVAAGLSMYMLWDTATWDLAAKVSAHRGIAECVAFSPDGTQFSVAGSSKNINIWETQTGRLATTLTGHSDEVWGLDFSPDGSRLVSASGDGTVKIWNSQGGNDLTLQAHSGSHVDDVVFSPDGTLLASAGSDGVINLHSAQTSQLIFRLKGHTAPVNKLSFSPDGARLASAGEENAVRIWNTVTGNEEAVLTHNHRASGVACSPDGTKIVTSSRGTITLWDAKTHEKMANIKSHQQVVYDVVFNHDGTHIASAGSDKTVKLWSVPAGREVRSFTGHTGRVNTVAFDLNSMRLISGGWDKYARIWDVDSGQQIAAALSLRGAVGDVVFSPDGERIVACGDIIHLHETATGDELMSLSSGRGAAGPSAAVYSGDGTQLAVSMKTSAPSTGYVQIFNAPRSHETAILKGHNAAVTSVTFNHNGDLLYSESDNEKLVWDFAMRKIKQNAAWAPPKTTTQTSPDGRWFVTFESNQVVLVDQEYKNMPDEKAYRMAKAKLVPIRHQEKAMEAIRSEDWYAAVFHYAWLLKHDPAQPLFYDELQSSFQKLKVQFEQEELELEPHLKPVVKESLKLPRGIKLPK